MASWIARVSGDIEDPAKIRELLGELRGVVTKPEYGAGSSEFTSAHVAASNFHEPDPEVQAPGEATGSPGGEGESGGESGGSPAATG